MKFKILENWSINWRMFFTHVLQAVAQPEFNFGVGASPPKRAPYMCGPHPFFKISLRILMSGPLLPAFSRKVSETRGAPDRNFGGS